jgi:hypothetical protein
MAELSLSVDDDFLQRVRARAGSQGTTVPALVRDYLERYVSGSDDEVADLVVLSKRSAGSSGAGGRTWERGDVYDR